MVRAAAGGRCSADGFGAGAGVDTRGFCGTGGGADTRGFCGTGGGADTRGFRGAGTDARGAGTAGAAGGVEVRCEGGRSRFGASTTSEVLHPASPAAGADGASSSPRSNACSTCRTFAPSRSSLGRARSSTHRAISSGLAAPSVPSIAAARSCAVGKRTSGSEARARMTMSSTASGMPRLIELGVVGTTSPAARLPSMPVSDETGKSCLPTRVSQSTTPAA
jgi:hypothetical protein